MTARERAIYVVDRFRQSIITGRKEDLIDLIEYHINDAVKEAVARTKKIQKTRASALVKARQARAEKREGKGGTGV